MVLWNYGEKSWKGVNPSWVDGILWAVLMIGMITVPIWGIRSHIVDIQKGWSEKEGMAAQVVTAKYGKRDHFTVIKKEFRLPENSNVEFQYFDDEKRLVSCHVNFDLVTGGMKKPTCTTPVEP